MAKVLAAMRRLEDAAKVYLSLQNTSLAGPDMMVAAAMCRQQAGAPFEETIALVDSAVNCCPQPLTFQSAKYVSIRANMYQQEGLYRKAINDFNLYEKLMVGYNLHPDFYYNRFICERESKQFQQALLLCMPPPVRGLHRILRFLSLFPRLMKDRLFQLSLHQCRYGNLQKGF